MSSLHSAAGRFLVLNGGSSSIKLACIDLPGGEVVCQALAERLGSEQARLVVKLGDEKQSLPLADSSHAGALAAMLEALERSPGGSSALAGVGHRVVHGGESFDGPVLIDAAVLEEVRKCERLAPLHNPANALVIEHTRRLFPGVPQVAVFDTAFHQSLPPHAYLYAIPYDLYSKLGVRRYGMHGTSHHYVALRAAEALKRPFGEISLITAHLGNGCSACAIEQGRSVDTTMGLTPLEGLMMGTRSGDVDPSLFGFLEANAGMSLEATTEMLNRKSGLLGVSGVSNDLRSVLEAADAGSERARIAVDLFCYRLAKGLLALTAGLSKLDALVFTGGIGENSSRIRARTASHLSLLGLRLDAARNGVHGRASGGLISAEQSPLEALVIPTNEEWMIARSTAECLA